MTTARSAIKTLRRFIIFCAAPPFLISSHKKGISSHQLARDIEVTQKTAWYMLQKVRTLFAQDDNTALEGQVECDEVYIGGKSYAQICFGIW